MNSSRTLYIVCARGPRWVRSIMTHDPAEIVRKLRACLDTDEVVSLYESANVGGFDKPQDVLIPRKQTKTRARRAK